MRNRETLGNVIFADPTASEAIRYVSIGEKRWTRKQLHLGRNSPDVVIYSARNESTITQSQQILKTKDPQTVRITELNQQLASLWIQKQEGQISSKEYGARQQELAQKLHEEMKQMGYRFIRTKKKHP